MSTPASNWSYTSAPVGVNTGRAVPKLMIAKATVGTLTQTQAPMISVPSNLYYFKAYGGDSTDGSAVIEFTNVDPVSSSAYNVTTRKYTAPVNGFYRFAALCYSAGDSETHVSLRRIRGSETITLQYVALKNVWESSGFSTEVFLEEGDQIDLYVNDGRVRLADYNDESFTLSALTYEPRTTFEGRLVYQTA